MALSYRVRTYRNAGELEAALNQPAESPWKPQFISAHGADGILVVYVTDSPASEVPESDHAAQVAEEANLLHEFPHPREED